jgi:hypothetical protein
MPDVPEADAWDLRHQAAQDGQNNNPLPYLRILFLVMEDSSTD